MNLNPWNRLPNKQKHQRPWFFLYCHGIFNNRQKRVETRMLKIASIANTSRRARVLFSGSGFPATAYGHQGCGLTKSAIENLERQAANCTGITRSGRCRTLALTVSYGKYGTPHARVIYETIIAWFSTLKSHLSLSKSNHLDILRTWPIARETLLEGRKGVSFSNVATRGLMSNVISILSNLGLGPIAYNVWEDLVTGTRFLQIVQSHRA